MSQCDPLDRLRVMAPVTVLWLICSKYVQVDTDLVVQFPLEPR